MVYLVYLKEHFGSKKPNQSTAVTQLDPHKNIIKATWTNNPTTEGEVGLWCGQS